MTYKLYRESSVSKMQVFKTTDINELANVIAYLGALCYSSESILPKFSVEAVEEVHDE